MINGLLLDAKIKPKYLILNKLKEMQAQYPKGLRPSEIAGLCGLPEPSVRRILGVCLKEGIVSLIMINKRCSMYRVIDCN